MSNCLTKCIYTWVLGSGGPLWAGPANRAAARLLEENRKRYPWTATRWPSLIILIGSANQRPRRVHHLCLQRWFKIGRQQTGMRYIDVYRLDMIGDGCLKWGIQMYMMYTLIQLIHDDSYGMLQHGLKLQPMFPGMEHRYPVHDVELPEPDVLTQGHENSVCTSLRYLKWV